MSESQSFYPNNPPKRGSKKVAAVALAAALVGGATGAAVEHTLNSKTAPSSTPSLERPLSKRDVEKIIHDEAAKKEFAEQQAAELTKQLNGKSKSAHMTILNGEIQIADAALHSMNTIKNPVILYVTEGMQYSSAKNYDSMLDNQYIGVVNNTKLGQVEITPVLFEKQTDRVTMHYTSHNDSTPTLAIAGVSELASKGAGQVNQVLAYDEQMGQWLTNPDGSILVVSETQGMK